MTTDSKEKLPTIKEFANMFDDLVGHATEVYSKMPPALPEVVKNEMAKIVASLCVIPAIYLKFLGEKENNDTEHS